ncbi:hypothetical protein TE101_06510 [Alteromonas macleodii]|nr:hypothetical protein TE101_06510 [Alteromonas macleodii]
MVIFTSPSHVSNCILLIFGTKRIAKGLLEKRKAITDSSKLSAWQSKNIDHKANFSAFFHSQFNALCC